MGELNSSTQSTASHDRGRCALTAISITVRRKRPTGPASRPRSRVRPRTSPGPSRRNLTDRKLRVAARNLSSPPIRGTTNPGMLATPRSTTAASAASRERDGSSNPGAGRLPHRSRPLAARRGAPLSGDGRRSSPPHPGQRGTALRRRRGSAGDRGPRSGPEDAADFSYGLSYCARARRARVGRAVNALRSPYSAGLVPATRLTRVRSRSTPRRWCVAPLRV